MMNGQLTRRGGDREKGGGEEGDREGEPEDVFLYRLHVKLR